MCGDVVLQGYVDASKTTIVSNSNAMTSYNVGLGALVEAGGYTTESTSADADTLLNNDYFYDDEFAVPFDIAPVPPPPLCRSLTDSCLDGGGDGRRRLTRSRSDACLCRSVDDSQADEMMSTSERAAGDFLMSSSELSDLDASRHRPLFSPVPPGGDGVRGYGEGSGSQLGESSASGEGGVRLRCAMYDAASARRQYRLSFGGGASTPTKMSSSVEDWKAAVDGGAGLTTWRQVSRVQPMEPGFTTWQRLRSSTGPTVTARSVNLVEWSRHGRHQTPACGADGMGRSGHLLRLYQSSRAPPSTQTGSDANRVDQHADVTASRAARGRCQRTGRRTVGGRTSVDKCVQCLPSFRDRCVQTTTSALLQADKSLQTSTLSSERVMHSALLLSRPLPDLDFLRLCTSSSAVQRRAELVDVVAGRRHSDGAPVGGGGTPSLGDSGHESSGRSSSTRRHHGSDSGLSNNSSSSSGIEPGDSAATSRPAAATSASVGPRKPPRSFTIEPRPPAVSQRRHTDGDLPPLVANNYSPAACVDDRCCCEEASRNRDDYYDDDDNDCRSAVTSDNFVLRGGRLRRWETTNCNVVDVDEAGDQTEDDSDTNQAVYSRDFVASHPLCRRSPPPPSRGRRKAVDLSLIHI